MLGRALVLAQEEASNDARQAGKELGVYDPRVETAERLVGLFHDDLRGYLRTDPTVGLAFYIGTLRRRRKIEAHLMIDCTDAFFPGLTEHARIQPLLSDEQNSQLVEALLDVERDNSHPGGEAAYFKRHQLLDGQALTAEQTARYRESE